MYTVHKEDEKRLQLNNSVGNFNKIDDPEALTKDEMQISPVIGNRFGSSRRSSHFPRHSMVGTSNIGFIPDEDKTVLHEAVEIIGDLPALHLEHCKL